MAYPLHRPRSMPTTITARQSRRATMMIGAAIMAGVDELVFHQILGWHHFYDRATPAIGLMTDGFLHAAELLVLVAGFFQYAELRRQNAIDALHAWSGFFLGAGGFQLFDGIVDHKLLRLHQIRYGVPTLPYDVAWNSFAIALLAIGFWIGARAKRAIATGDR